MARRFINAAGNNSVTVADDGKGGMEDILQEKFRKHLELKLIVFDLKGQRCWRIK